MASIECAEDLKSGSSEYEDIPPAIFEAEPLILALLALHGTRKQLLQGIAVQQAAAAPQRPAGAGANRVYPPLSLAKAEAGGISD